MKVRVIRKNDYEYIPVIREVDDQCITYDADTYQLSFHKKDDIAEQIEEVELNSIFNSGNRHQVLRGLIEGSALYRTQGRDEFHMIYHDLHALGIVDWSKLDEGYEAEDKDYGLGLPKGCEYFPSELPPIKQTI